MPAHDRHGRVHTSTVTVAVLADTPTGPPAALRDADIETFFTKDTGPGGQHRNKTESCVVMRHLPTGIEARASGRCQHQNRRLARAQLEARVQAQAIHASAQALAVKRRALVGSGARADKIRTYRVQDGVVIDHRLGSKYRLKAVLQGELPA